MALDPVECGLHLRAQLAEQVEAAGPVGLLGEQREPQRRGVGAPVVAGEGVSPRVAGSPTRSSCRTLPGLLVAHVVGHPRPRRPPSSRTVSSATSGMNGSACVAAIRLSRPNRVANQGTPAAKNECPSSCGAQQRRGPKASERAPCRTARRRSAREPGPAAGHGGRAARRRSPPRRSPAPAAARRPRELDLEAEHAASRRPPAPRPARPRWCGARRRGLAEKRSARPSRARHHGRPLVGRRQAAEGEHRLEVGAQAQPSSRRGPRGSMASQREPLDQPARLASSTHSSRSDRNPRGEARARRACRARRRPGAAPRGSPPTAVVRRQEAAVAVPEPEPVGLGRQVPSRGTTRNRFSRLMTSASARFSCTGAAFPRAATRKRTGNARSERDNYRKSPPFR